MLNRLEILDTAKSCVSGQREQDHGKAENNFELIAKFWSSYLDHEVTSVDVALMMTLLKIARIHTGRQTEDSFVDACGYISCGGEIATSKMDSDCDENSTTIFGGDVACGARKEARIKWDSYTENNHN